ncbi:hypothetical protein PTKIN_Ptkin07bG0276100 [Pterospermum kingtungense]
MEVSHVGLFQDSSFRWEPPMEGYIKINVDAALQVHSSSATVGVVFRDNAGVIQGSAATSLQNICSPLAAELLAILYGLQLAKELDFGEVMVESDCLVAVTEIGKGESSFSEWSSLVKDIVDLRDSLED